MKQNNENTNAFLIHICGFAGFLFPFGSIITPLIAWQTLKTRSPFLDDQGKEAVNFNISFSLYKFLISIAFLPFVIGSFLRGFSDFSIFNWNHFEFNFDSNHYINFLGFGFFVGILAIIRVILTINAALKAKEGENFTYPLTIKFLK